jgi:hypothetical protein
MPSHRDSGSGRPRRRTPGRQPRAEEQATARVLTVEDRCWQCRSKVRGIVGVLVDAELTADRSGFLPFDAVAPALSRALDARTLAARRIGQLKHRDSPGVRGGYLSNGCAECDALIGRFQLEDLLHEHLTRGGALAQLDIGVRAELALAAPGQLRAAR